MRIDVAPFYFAGQSLMDIQAQCEDFFSSSGRDDFNGVDDVAANWTSRHKDVGFWKPAEVCMMVTALAGGR